MKLSSFFLIFILLLQSDLILAKPFKRILVLSGGGINPGATLGMIAGVREMGWRPDLIIVTCGSALGGIINNSEQSIRGSFDVLRSWEHFNALNQVVIETTNGIELMNKLQAARKTDRYPAIFEGNLLYAPMEYPRYFRNQEFNRNPEKTKLIIISARALFWPYQVGQLRMPEPLFQEVFFTDPETALLLNGRKLPKRQSYPFTTLKQETLAISSVDAVTAARAGTADPYLMNPGIVDGYYHFTGAVDLFPLDLATALGDEVVATYPASLFLEYEDIAVKSGFGFTQTQRALEAIQHKDVKWIDINGADALSFNPSRLLLFMRSGIPTDFMKFKLGVAKQWDFGRNRANEAIRMAPGKVTDVRFHLRKPINPKLLNEFSCKNAFEWKTEKREFCVNDAVSGCDRRKAKKCFPIR